MRKLLVNRDSPQLQSLKKLVKQQKHRTLVMWTIDCAEDILTIFENKFPKDNRPREALEAAKSWAAGKIKMPIAKKAAYATHNAAIEAGDDNPAARAAARVMGHVIGTIHVETHAMGVVMYGITAFVYANNQEKAEKVITERCDWFYNRLKYWEKNINKVETTWVLFLLKDANPNKEAKLFRRKNKRK